MQLLAQNIKRGTPAADWWNGITAGDKDTWAKASAQFKTQWPPPLRTPTMGIAAKKALLLTLKLDKSKLGKMEGTGKYTNYTHVKWAEKAKRLWKGLNNPSGHLLDQVRPNLPSALLETIVLALEKRNDGSEFFKAVKNVDVEAMIKKQTALKSYKELEQLVATMSLTLPTTASQTYSTPHPQPQHYFQPQFYPLLQTYMPPQRRGQHPAPPQTPAQPTATTNVQTPKRDIPPHMGPGRQLPSPPNLTLGHPFADETTPRPNSFMDQMQNQPTSPLMGRGPESHKLAKKAAAESTLYPDTPKGKAAYQRAFQEWTRQHGEHTLCTFITPRLPLFPGTLPLGFRECYTCGVATNPLHLSFDCPVPDNKRISIKERQWRTYINKALASSGPRLSYSPQTPNQRRPPYAPPVTASIAQVMITDDGWPYDANLYPSEGMYFKEDLSSGNGQESHY